jgi:hypothetical protein
MSPGRASARAAPPPGPAHDDAQHERDQDRFVQLAGDGDEVGHQVEGKGEVADEQEDERLAPPRHAPLGEQAAEQHDAVRDEPGQGTGVGVAPR